MGCSLGLYFDEIFEELNGPGSQHATLYWDTGICASVLLVQIISQLWNRLMGGLS